MERVNIKKAIHEWMYRYLTYYEIFIQKKCQIILFILIFCFFSFKMKLTFLLIEMNLTSLSRKNNDFEYTKDKFLYLK